MIRVPLIVCFFYYLLSAFSQTNNYYFKVSIKSFNLNIFWYFCILDLTKHVVKDYEGIENLMDEGNTNR